MEKLYELAAEYTGNTKSNKSQGSNGIHSGVLKEFKDETVELWCVCNLSIKSVFICEDW